jgi:hypothetical protein
MSSNSLFAEILKDEKNREKAMKKLSVLKDIKEEQEVKPHSNNDIDNIPVPSDNGPVPPPPAPPVPDQVST